MDVLNQNERSVTKKESLLCLILDLYLLMTSYISMFVTQIKYKEDLQILRGLGCFLYDTPDMVRSRHLRKLWVSAHRPNTQLLLHSFTKLGRRSLSVASVKGKFAINSLRES